MKQYIETQRLILRSWQEADIPHLARMNSGDRVMEYFLKTLSYEETITLYNQIRKRFDDELIKLMLKFDCQSPWWAENQYPQHRKGDTILMLGSVRQLDYAQSNGRFSQVDERRKVVGQRAHTCSLGHYGEHFDRFNQ